MCKLVLQLAEQMAGGCSAKMGQLLVEKNRKQPNKQTTANNWQSRQQVAVQQEGGNF